ncbi:TPA: UDP-N-acetylmuramate--L-alanine ligase [Candidatus Poribacteria bacterium]|nr:UDP-N-acetylmuramate--L-alanine ligase [Candidatus Poribacteria bacterium]
MLGKTRHIHLVGIGGVAMSGIAKILLSSGFSVSGSDLRQSSLTEQLAQLGGKIYVGHAAEQIGDADVVVMSPAIPDDNPEVLQAKQGKIPVIRGAEMLAEIMRLKYSVAISGTHGKTTTTAMTAAVLENGGLDPTVVVGGRLVSLGSNARIGQGDFMVVEADEAYGSIKKYWPTIAVVTAVDYDHLDYYKDIQDIGETFLDFINRVPFYGTAVLCLDQENIQALIPRVEKQFTTYGLETRADITAHEIRFDGPTAIFQVQFDNDVLGEIHLKMPGLHNVSNSLAAISVGLQLDIPFSRIKEALESFQGVHRRFEIIGEVNGVMVVDDYAHNPAKLKATFNAARSSFSRRIVAVFQPHRYQRVKHLAEEFSRSFYQTDILIVTDIYGAGERPIEGVNAENLVTAIIEHGHKNVIYIPDKDQIADYLADNIVQPNDIVITVGAGDVWVVGRQLLTRLQMEFGIRKSL